MVGFDHNYSDCGMVLAVRANRGRRRHVRAVVVLGFGDGWAGQYSAASWPMHMRRRNCPATSKVQVSKSYVQRGTGLRDSHFRDSHFRDCASVLAQRSIPPFRKWDQEGRQARMPLSRKVRLVIQFRIFSTLVSSN